MSKYDGEQVRRVLAGDQTAYESLVEAYQGRMFAFVASRIRNFSATEDVVQNAFVEAYVNLKSLKSPEKFAGWLRGIALNLSNKWIGQKRPGVSIDDMPEGEINNAIDVSLPDLPDEVLAEGEMKDAVLKAVNALPEIYREAVLFHYMEGMTYPEIAAFLEVSESTVTGRLQVARNRLRDDLMPLVEGTLQEKRATPHLTRKVMAALPPLLYIAPAQASLFATLKGSTMLKTMGIIGAGIVGTGLYFGGIVSMLGLEDRDTEPGKISFELSSTEISKEKTGDDVIPSAGESANEKEVVDTKPQPSAPEKITFKTKFSAAADSSLTVTFTTPESYRDSVAIEFSIFDVQGMLVEKIPEESYKGDCERSIRPLSISNGMYFIQLVANGDPKFGQTRRLVVNWRDKK